MLSVGHFLSGHKLRAHGAVFPNRQSLKQRRVLQFQMKEGTEPVCFKKKKKKDTLLWIVFLEVQKITAEPLHAHRNV